jgi:putative ABC transport system ATP-binding protein
LKLSKSPSRNPRTAIEQLAAPNMLEAINLSKTYASGDAEYRVLKNVDLEIRAGECAAIIGKSGSGKSTLMHLLACLDQPTSGAVRFESADFQALTEKEKDDLRNEKFGFVFQQFFLNGHETVFENVVLPLRIRGAENYDIVKNAMNALEAVGLKDKETKKAKELSGGEKQRVCIARALVGEPRVIFADEPTGNLDSATSAIVEEMLFRLNKEKGITLIIVTHDDELAAKCARVIELKDGEVIADRRRSVPS